MTKGKLTGVGVGPGDPELLTMCRLSDCKKGSSPGRKEIKNVFTCADDKRKRPAEKNS